MIVDRIFNYILNKSTNSSIEMFSGLLLVGAFYFNKELLVCFVIE